MRVTFLGAGLYGEALGQIATLNRHEVKYYDPLRFPEVSLEEALEGAEAILYVAPASAADELLPKLPTKIPFILASKGFISMEPFKKFKKFSAIGGAAFAEDILNGYTRLSPEVLLTASSQVPIDLFAAPDIHIQYHNDPKGIMLCGALKNVYAIAAGIFMNEGQEDDFFTLAFYEMNEFMAENDCNPKSAALSCGLPDLILSSDMDSRNFRFGDEIRDFPKSKIEPTGTVEGITVIQSLDKYPDFIIPEDANLFRTTVKKVKYATE